MNGDLDEDKIDIENTKSEHYRDEPVLSKIQETIIITDIII